MTWLDITIIIIITILTVIGLRMGIIRAAAAAVGIIAGAALAGRFYLPVSGALSFIIRNETWAKTASFILIYLVILVAVSIVGSIIRRLFSSLLFLGWLDVIVGGVLGFLVGAGVLSVVLSVLGSFDGLGVSEAMKKSAVASLIMTWMPAMLDLLPKEFDVRSLIAL